MNLPKYSVSHKLLYPLYKTITLLSLLIVLVGCASEPEVIKTPFFAPPGSVRQPTIVSVKSPAPNDVEQSQSELQPAGEPTSTADLAGIQPERVVSELAEPTEDATALSLPGYRPQQVHAIVAPDADFELTVEWRPPPVPVPHALNPDDHYWLSRPIPSDNRNYDLEWYPYGNQPLKRELLPYRVHHGMDFPNTEGTPVFAASSGTVIWAGPLRNARNGVNYYGNTVIILHDWQWMDQSVYTLYAHTLELFVEVGEKVNEGELLAGVGASGEVSGPHLHLEVRVGSNNYNSTRNPALWLAPYEGWGVLAGRFMDSTGEPIHGALVRVIPIKVDTNLDLPIRTQRTYAKDGINADEMWQENFVVADLPAGKYEVVLSTAGRTFRREVNLLPEQTNYVIFQADFDWSPTPVPTPLPTNIPTLSPNASITNTIGITPTILFAPTQEP